MRWASLLLVGCGFSASLPSGAQPDGTPGNEGAPGDSGVDTPNGSTVVTRQIDVVDGKVTGGPHADFPLLVTAPITAAHPMGFDIAFSADPAGVTKLAHEIERYAPGELVAWVKVPLLADPTVLYIHYGDASITMTQENRAAVWSAGYAAVFHLTDVTDATTQNATTDSGTAGAAGHIAGARAFTTDRLTAGSANAVDNIFAGGGTAELWFRATAWGGSDLGRVFDKGPSNTVIGMCHDIVSAAFLVGRSFSNNPGNWCTPSDSLALNTWTHVAVVYDDGSSANVPVIYINGVAQTVTAEGTPSGTAVSEANATLAIGDRTSGGRAFAGSLDELRLSTVMRSAGWITTAYENQRDPGAFVTIAP